MKHYAVLAGDSLVNTGEILAVVKGVGGVAKWLRKHREGHNSRCRCYPHVPVDKSVKSWVGQVHKYLLPNHQAYRVIDLMSKAELDNFMLTHKWKAGYADQRHRGNA
jgi:hypothetical protein